MEVLERPANLQRSATTDCRDDWHVFPTQTQPGMRRSVSMDVGDADGVRKMVSGFSGSFKRRSLRVSSQYD